MVLGSHLTMKSRQDLVLDSLRLGVVETAAPYRFIDLVAIGV